MTRLWKMGPFIRSTLWLKNDFFAGDRVIGILLYRHKKKLLYSFNLSVSHSLDKAGLRHPASASCFEKHLRLAGRGPNNDSLFPPLAAVIVVAPTEGSLWRRGKAFRNAKASPR